MTLSHHLGSAAPQPQARVATGLLMIGFLGMMECIRPQTMALSHHLGSAAPQAQACAAAKLLMFTLDWLSMNVGMLCAFSDGERPPGQRGAAAADAFRKCTGMQRLCVDCFLA